MQSHKKYDKIYSIFYEREVFVVNDLIIIGAGAAGMCAAVYFKKNNPDKSVRIIEALPRVGKKLSVTGNGRCNITNKDINIDRYHGENREFCRYALETYDLKFTEDFFSSIGVDLAFEGDKGYPASFGASSVVDCLRFALEEMGVLLNLETPVTNIQISGDCYKVICNSIGFLAKNIIIASGLYSGGERYGCDGSLIKILERAGFKALKATPAIVQVKTETDTVKQLKGIKLNAKATLKCDNGFSRTETGEVLFCDYGLSGPPILQISREISRAKQSVIFLDLMPEASFDGLVGALLQRRKNLKTRKLEEFFTGMLQKRVGQVLLKAIGCKLSDTADTLSIAKIKELAALIKSWKFAVTGTTGFANSQVSAGGLDTRDFCPKTMESKQAKGIYCVGEILDIDGDCGGFNLQWAWSSAFCAAAAIKEKL